MNLIGEPMKKKSHAPHLRLAWSDEEAWNRKLIQLACGCDNKALAEHVEMMRRRAKLELCNAPCVGKSSGDTHA